MAQEIKKKGPEHTSRFRVLAVRGSDGREVGEHMKRARELRKVI